jgi:hypothetical protein
MADERLQSDGAIYTNNYKKQPKHPDWTGKVTLSKDILKELVTKMRSENADSAEMRVALWDRTSKAGNEYKYARLDVPQEKKEEPKPEPKPEVDEFADDIPF